MKEFEQQATRALKKAAQTVKGFLRDSRQDLKKAAAVVRKEWKRMEPYNISIARFPSEVARSLPAEHWCTGRCAIGKDCRHKSGARTWCKACPVGVTGDAAIELREYVSLKVTSKRIARAFEQQMIVDLPPLPEKRISRDYGN